MSIVLAHQGEQLFVLELSQPLSIKDAIGKVGDEEKIITLDLDNMLPRTISDILYMGLTPPRLRAGQAAAGPGAGRRADA